MTKSDLKRKPDEHILDYKYRICDRRLEYGLATWQDVRVLLNKECNEEYSADTYRKQYEHWKQWQEHMQNKVSNDDVFKELEDKRIALQKERIRLQDQKREINSLVRQQARFEYIEEKLEKAIYDLAKAKPLLFVPPVRTFNPSYEAVVLFSDWHAGIFCSNYWNHFDNDELVRRVTRFVTESIKAATLHETRVLHIFSLGDLINGLIHVTSRILATEDAITQTMRVCELMSEVVAEYANTFDKINLYFVNGNHDRTIANKSEVLSVDSFTRFVPFYMKQRLAGFRNVEFVENVYDLNIAQGEVAGYLCYGVHGDKDSVNNVVQNLTLMTSRKPDYIFMGHIHHHFEDEVHSTEIIVNSSLSGVDEYAKEFRKTSKPAQKLLIFNEKVGRYATYNIRLDVA